MSVFKTAPVGTKGKTKDEKSLKILKGGASKSSKAIESSIGFLNFMVSANMGPRINTEGGQEWFKPKPKPLIFFSPKNRVSSSGAKFGSPRNNFQSPKGNVYFLNLLTDPKAEKKRQPSFKIKDNDNKSIAKKQLNLLKTPTKDKEEKERNARAIQTQTILGRYSSTGVKAKGNGKDTIEKLFSNVLKEEPLTKLRFGVKTQKNSELCPVQTQANGDITFESESIKSFGKSNSSKQLINKVKAKDRQSLKEQSEKVGSNGQGLMAKLSNFQEYVRFEVMETSELGSSTGELSGLMSNEKREVKRNKQERIEFVKQLLQNQKREDERIRKMNENQENRSDEKNMIKKAFSKKEKQKEEQTEAKKFEEKILNEEKSDLRKTHSHQDIEINKKPKKLKADQRSFNLKRVYTEKNQPEFEVFEDRVEENEFEEPEENLRSLKQIHMDQSLDMPIIERVYTSQKRISPRRIQKKEKSPKEPELASKTRSFQKIKVSSKEISSSQKDTKEKKDKKHKEGSKKTREKKEEFRTFRNGESPKLFELSLKKESYQIPTQKNPSIVNEESGHKKEPSPKITDLETEKKVSTIQKKPSPKTKELKSKTNQTSLIELSPKEPGPKKKTSLKNKEFTLKKVPSPKNSSPKKKVSLKDSSPKKYVNPEAETSKNESGFASKKNLIQKVQFANKGTKPFYQKESNTSPQKESSPNSQNPQEPAPQPQKPESEVNSKSSLASIAENVEIKNPKEKYRRRSLVKHDTFGIINLSQEKRMLIEEKDPEPPICYLDVPGIKKQLTLPILEQNDTGKTGHLSTEAEETIRKNLRFKTANFGKSNDTNSNNSKSQESFSKSSEFSVAKMKSVEDFGQTFNYESDLGKVVRVPPKTVTEIHFELELGKKNSNSDQKDTPKRSREPQYDHFDSIDGDESVHRILSSTENSLSNQSVSPLICEKRNSHVEETIQTPQTEYKKERSKATFCSIGHGFNGEWEFEEMKGDCPYQDLEEIKKSSGQTLVESQDDFKSMRLLQLTKSDDLKKNLGSPVNRKNFEIDETEMKEIREEAQYLEMEKNKEKRKSFSIDSSVERSPIKGGKMISSDFDLSMNSPNNQRGRVKTMKELYKRNSLALEEWQKIKDEPKERRGSFFPVNDASMLNESILNVSRFDRFKCTESFCKTTNHLDVTINDEQEKQINEYVIKKDLGKGGFGKVKLALHKKENKLYAIKIANKRLLQRKFLSKNETALSLLQKEIAVMKLIVTFCFFSGLIVLRFELGRTI